MAKVRTEVSQDASSMLYSWRAFLMESNGDCVIALNSQGFVSEEECTAEARTFKARYEQGVRERALPVVTISRLLPSEGGA